MWNGFVFHKEFLEKQGTCLIDILVFHRVLILFGKSLFPGFGLRSRKVLVSLGLGVID